MRKSLQRKSAQTKPAKNNAPGDLSGVKSKILSHVLRIRPTQMFILMIPALSMTSIYMAQLVFSSQGASAETPYPHAVLCEFNDQRLFDSEKNVQECLKLIEQNIHSAKEIIRVSTTLREKISNSQKQFDSETQAGIVTLGSAASSSAGEKKPQSQSPSEPAFGAENGNSTEHTEIEKPSIGAALNHWLDHVISQVSHALNMDDKDKSRKEPEQIEFELDKNPADDKPLPDKKQSKGQHDTMNTTQQEVSLCGR